MVTVRVTVTACDMVTLKERMRDSLAELILFHQLKRALVPQMIFSTSCKRKIEANTKQNTAIETTHSQKLVEKKGTQLKQHDSIQYSVGPSSMGEGAKREKIYFLLFYFI